VVVRSAVLTTVLVGVAVGLAPPPATALTPSRAMLTEYDASLSPSHIVAGPDGNMWFTSSADSRIGRITPTGEVTLYITPTVGSMPIGIDAGADGNLWFVEALAGKIGRITVDGSITEFTIPISGGWPLDIAAGPDGNMWFTELYGNRIGRITPEGAITEYRLRTADSQPVGIISGPDGRMWFTEGEGAKIGRIATDGTISELPLPQDRIPVDLAVGPDGNVWVAEGSSCCIDGYIARISATGDITEFPISGDPSYITSFRGALWFTEAGEDEIGWMSTLGAVRLRDIPGDRNLPAGIAPRPGGTLWFCENNKQVAQISFP
jgi:streptogramin lyase